MLAIVTVHFFVWKINIWYIYDLQEFVIIVEGFAKKLESNFIAWNRPFFVSYSTGNISK